MLAWTRRFPSLAKPLAYLRLVRARHRYWERTYLGFWEGELKLLRKPGYQQRIAEHHNKFADKRCFILCNGPSLQTQDLSPLKNEITIGSNGIYKGFDDFGFHTDFLFFEDIEQLELKRKDWRSHDTHSSPPRLSVYPQRTPRINLNFHCLLKSLQLNLQLVSLFTHVIDSVTFLSHL